MAHVNECWVARGVGVVMIVVSPWVTTRVTTMIISAISFGGVCVVPKVITGKILQMLWA